MSDTPSSSVEQPKGGSVRGRGRGKSRGGLGKYLRARGRRGSGRPAEFQKRLVFEDEEDLEGEEAGGEAAHIALKYSKRRLETNADRYVEPEPELDSDNEVKQEPEVDISAFLERQRISEGPSAIFEHKAVDEEEPEIDESVSPIFSRIAPASRNSKKGQVQQIQWDEQLEEMSREKAAAEAARDLKERFRSRSAYLTDTGGSHRQSHREKRQEKGLVNAPPLPFACSPRNGQSKEELQDFLDDLLG